MDNHLLPKPSAASAAFISSTAAAQHHPHSAISLSSSSASVAATLIPSTESSIKKVNHFKKVTFSLIPGAIAGALAKTTIAPLDRTKINFQVTPRPFCFREAFRFMLNSYNKDGLLSLWRGNSATMARVMPYAAIQFSSHEQFKKLLQVQTNAQKRDHKIRSFAAGSLAGIVSVAFTYPMDLAKARMAVTNKAKYKTLRSVFVVTVREEGLLALYKGYSATLLGVIPYAGVAFFSYETFKRYHFDYTGHSEPNPVERLLFGAVSGLAAQSASYPLDIVRRRMQICSAEYKSILQTLLKVYREEGLLHGLFKGLTMNFVKGPLAFAVSFTTFDYVNAFFVDLQK